MSDYSLQVTWSTKDALTGGQALKTISATELGNEFSAISTAVATKYDSDDLASQSAAELETATDKLLSPKSLAYWSDYNAGIVGELQALADPNADGLLMWDDGEAANSNVVFATLGTGLSFTANVIDLEAGLQAISALAKTDGNIIVGNGSTWVAESGATARTSLGLAIGTNVQAWDANLDQIAALAVTDSNFIVGNGSAWVAESGATARTSLGVGTGDSPQFTAVNLSHATATTLTGSSGQVLVEGKGMFQHNGSYTSGEVFYSTSAPTTEGGAGDLYFEYTA